MFSHQQITSGSSVLLPKIDVVVVVSRQNTQPEWVTKCLDSIRNQAYHNLGLITIENNAKTLTIGAAWNLAARKSTADWLYFVGDDDLLHPMAISVLAASIPFFSKQLRFPEALSLISTGLSLITEQGDLIGFSDTATTGLIRRSVITKLEFNHTLLNGVDDEFLSRLTAAGYVTTMLNHTYYYYYRQHPGQVSGMAEIKTAANGR